MKHLIKKHRVSGKHLKTHSYPKNENYSIIKPLTQGQGTYAAGSQNVAQNQQIDSSNTAQGPVDPPQNLESQGPQIPPQQIQQVAQQMSADIPPLPLPPPKDPNATGGNDPTNPNTTPPPVDQQTIAQAVPPSTGDGGDGGTNNIAHAPPPPIGDLDPVDGGGDTNYIAPPQSFDQNSLQYFIKSQQFSDAVIQDIGQTNLTGTFAIFNDAQTGSETQDCLSSAEMTNANQLLSQCQFYIDGSGYHFNPADTDEFDANGAPIGLQKQILALLLNQKFANTKAYELGTFEDQQQQLDVENSIGSTVLLALTSIATILTLGGSIALIGLEYAGSTGAAAVTSEGLSAIGTLSTLLDIEDIGSSSQTLTTFVTKLTTLVLTMGVASFVSWGVATILKKCGDKIASTLDSIRNSLNDIGQKIYDSAQKTFRSFGTGYTTLGDIDINDIVGDAAVANKAVNGSIKASAVFN
jgi:hypothetical protein